MTALSFRTIGRDYMDGGPIANYDTTAFPAFWTVINDRKTMGGEKEFDATLLDWTNRTIECLLEWRRPITAVQRLNTLLYRGKHYMHQDPLASVYAQRRLQNQNLSQYAKVVLNYLGQAADSYVAEQCAYEPALAVRPKNDEESDRVAARMSKMALDHYFYILRAKTKFLPFHLRTIVHGEAFMFTGWNPDAGDVHPSYRKYLEMKRAQGLPEEELVPLVDPETGEPVKNQEGDPIYLTQSVKTGDVVVRNEFSERVLYPTPPSCLWEDVPYVHNLLLMEVDEVKARWPRYAEQIRRDSMYHDYFGSTFRSLSQLCVVRYTYHKPTPFLEKGFTMYSTEHCILQRGDKEFNHDDLPCIRATDIDCPDELTGMSRFQNLATLNQALNNSTSGILQNQMQFAYPKYAAPRGAKVKYVQLGDDRGIYEYSGLRGPELMAKNSTPEDTWRWREAMRSEFKTLAALDGPQSGEAPKGITANVALRMLEEQHRKLRKPSIDKHGDCVERLGFQILSVLGTYRDPLDGSLISVLGKNNERYLKYFDVTNLSKPFSVELIKTSGLPESPAAKTQTVMDMAQTFPGMWSNDEVLEYLDIARPEKLVESATLSRQSAESEVEDMLSGIAVPPPALYHDILPRYRVYEKAVQSRAFDDADPIVKQMVITHIMAAEYVIAKKMKLNPAFAQKVIEGFPNFPMYFPTQPAPSEPFMLAEAPQPLMDPNAPPLGGLPPEAAMADVAAPPESSQTPSPGALPLQPTAPPPGELP